MKKLLIAVLILLVASVSYAAEYVYQSEVKIIGENIRVITFQCQGGAGGAITDTEVTAENMRRITGWFLYKVTADHGTTAPDAADVVISVAGGEDLLNGNGVNLIHATTQQSTYPEIDGQAAKQPIIETITLEVNNQGTAAAHFNIDLIFTRF